MRIDWDTPVSELTHSDDSIAYIDLDENEIAHFKYIKREKVNGKWRYYYRDDEYEKAKNDYEHAVREEERTRENLKATLKKNDAITDEINKSYNEKYGDKAGSNEHWPEVFDAMAPYIKENIEAKTTHQKALKNTLDSMYSYTKAKKEYEKSAGHKVADLLNKASDKIDKAKKWITSIFKR